MDNSKKEIEVAEMRQESEKSMLPGEHMWDQPTTKGEGAEAAFSSTKQHNNDYCNLESVLRPY